MDTDDGPSTSSSSKDGQLNPLGLLSGCVLDLRQRDLSFDGGLRRAIFEIQALCPQVVVTQASGYGTR